MREVSDRLLGAYTTLRLGGPADRLLEVDDTDEIISIVREADRKNDPLLILAGGSNVVIADSGFPGTVVVLRSSGIRVTRQDDHVELTVAAGHSWDDVVTRAVTEGWSGIEALSGIPGSAGATPIQNVGAYGQEVAETITSVRVLDRHRDQVITMSGQECGFGYRHSVFKGSDRWVVLEVTYRLAISELSGPVRYPELARTLDVAVGDRAPLRDVRDAVLGLRRRKGMVLDPADPDTASAGSFFINPVLDPAGYQALVGRCAAVLGAQVTPPAYPTEDGRVKTSAAWLIERAGFGKGYPGDGVAISSKHTLALTNRGSGTTAALLKLAGEIRDGVRQRFGITLRPEPILVGCTL